MPFQSQLVDFKTHRVKQIWLFLMLHPMLSQHRQCHQLCLKPHQQPHLVLPVAPTIPNVAPKVSLLASVVPVVPPVGQSGQPGIGSLPGPVLNWSYFKPEFIANQMNK